MPPMAVSNITNLPHLYFQPALSSQVVHNATSALEQTKGSISPPRALHNDRLGELVTDTEDVGQCIRIILTTPKGCTPHRPLFGSNLHLYLDHPINSARPHIVREAVNALNEWEPRIVVEQVTVSLAGVAELICSVRWRFAAEISANSFETQLALGGTS